MDEPFTGALFGISSLCLLVAATGVRPRAFTALGAAVLLAVLVLIETTQGAPLSLVLVVGIPALCIAGMATVREGSPARTTKD